MRLNWDILVLLPFYTEHSSDILPIMLTCKTLYGAGTKAVLGRTIYLRSRKELSLFCGLVHEDTVARARYLKEIELDWNSSSWALENVELAYGFASALKHAQCLRRLSVKSAEGLLSNEATFEALVSMTSVKELYIHRANEPTQAQFLQRICSAIEVAHVSCDNGAASQFEQAARHILASLARFRQSLHTLHLWGPTPTTLSDTVFPAVRFLDFTCWDAIQTHSIAHAFPNARDITFSLRRPLDRLWRAAGSGTEMNGDHVRAMNLGGPLCWVELDHLAGPVTVLYSAGVRSKVHTLDLNIDPGTDVSLIRTVLDDTQPARLNVCWFTHWGAFQKDVHGFMSVASSKLTRLDVTVVKQSDPQDAVVSAGTCLGLVRYDAETSFRCSCVLRSLEPMGWKSWYSPFAVWVPATSLRNTNTRGSRARLPTLHLRCARSR